MSDSSRNKYACPTCGHPILPSDPFAILGPTQRRIFNLVHAAGQAGINSQLLAERAYAGTSGGASGSLVSVHIRHINNKLRLLKLHIVSTRLGSHGANYVVRRFGTLNGDSHGLHNGYGEDNTASRLTAEQVKRIRQDGRSNRTIAKAYGVAGRTIDRIKRRESWKHI